jgi:hypothetical protein
MPQFENIPAGAYDPEAEADVSEESLEVAVAEAREEVDRIRAEQYEIRQTAPKAKLLEALQPSDAELQEAIVALSDAERRLGRFRGAGPGQTVPVGTASDSEEASE